MCKGFQFISRNLSLHWMNVSYFTNNQWWSTQLSGLPNTCRLGSTSSWWRTSCDLGSVCDPSFSKLDICWHGTKIGSITGRMCWFEWSWVLRINWEETSKGSGSSSKEIVKSLDDGKVWIFSVSYCFVETSKRQPKRWLPAKPVKCKLKQWNAS